jgi:hypothetical protein
MSVHSTLAAHVTHSPSRVLGLMHGWCAVHTHASCQHLGSHLPSRAKVVYRESGA